LPAIADVCSDNMPNKILGRIILILGAISSSAVIAAPVLMISVDGLKPEYVLEADARGLKIPFLRSMVRDGVFAHGVVGVYPTVTYPSHTTLLTGVAPNEHGILNNLEFDPLHQHGESWYWYAEQIHAPTLWQAAHAAGLATASIGWPVSVGAPVNFLIPEYWRLFRPGAELNPSDVDLIAALSRPDGMLQAMQHRLGPYMLGNDTSLSGDATKTRFALEILHLHKPAFMTIHLSSLDDAEHGHGPFSTEANQDLEALDGMLARLFAAAHANDAHAVSLVVSDHGFAPITRRVNLYPAFLDAGLIQGSVDAKTQMLTVASWQATPWMAGGMAAIMLHDTDAHTETRVRELLQGLKADETNGIAEILERGAIEQRGGFPGAAFLVVMKLGYTLANDASGDRVSDISGSHGSHGFSPAYPEMRASFFMSGSRIAHNRDLGVIDMRQIAPTVAAVLQVPFPSAKAAPLTIRP
jgi:predicted AlkP superfamily pyrophosphatase or phosphodiesterase